MNVDRVPLQKILHRANCIQIELLAATWNP
jgi:hypothetical protein